MDARREANLRVKHRITDALFALIQEKSLAQITVTELVQAAGVARASFYRNYASKEDVLLTMVRDILEELSRELDCSGPSFYTYGNVLRSFQYLHRYRRYLMDLCRSGFVELLLEELNHFHENVAGTMPSSSIEKYRLYMYIGALLNTALVWLWEGAKQSPEEMAAFFLEAMDSVVRTDAPVGADE